MRWYVMRDLKRANAKVPAYKLVGRNEDGGFRSYEMALGHPQGNTYP